MSQPPKILVVGSINMDLVIRTERMPREGETLCGQELVMVPGGKGANQAVGARRLGAEVNMVGRVGDDPFGQQLLDNLAREGVDISQVAKDHETPTGIALIVINAQGQNSIIVAPGANRKMKPQDLEPVEPLFDQMDILMLQFEVPMEIVERAAALANRHGATVILDAGPAQPCSRELLRSVDILSPNEREAEALSGVAITDLKSAEQAAEKFLDQGVKIVVLKLGENGALLATQEGMEHFSALSVSVVDTTAAGDAFTAGLAVRYAETSDFGEAVRFANRAGALAVTKLGAQPSLPIREEVERLAQ